MGTGWVKIHRQLRDQAWYNHSPTVHVFLDLLLTANRDTGRKVWFKRLERVLGPGQWWTTAARLSASTGLSRQCVRTALNTLKSTNTITIEADRQGSVITVINWEKWQESTNESTSPQPTPNQPLTTKQEYKNTRIRRDLRSLQATQFNIWYQQIEDAYPPSGRLYRESARGQLKLLRPTEEMVTAILEGIDRWKSSEQWTEANGKYVPSLTKFLSNHMWGVDVPLHAQNWKHRVKTQVAEDDSDY